MDDYRDMDESDRRLLKKRIAELERENAALKAQVIRVEEERLADAIRAAREAE